MEQIINNQLSIVNRRGVALLVVLIVIMAITILSLGFLTKSDVELACGQNMVLRTQVDYLAESGLEHARGLILNPQDISSEYWTGAVSQQLVAGSDEYYDLTVVRDDTDPTDQCNYTIDSNSYRLEAGEKTAISSLRAQLRLDPSIALWIGNDATLWDGVKVKGDIYCNGALTNNTPNGAISGDVFANVLNGNDDITGRLKPVADLSLSWPRVTVSDFTSNYSTQTISSGSISNRKLGPYDPVRLCYRSGDLILAGNVRIEGMLIVDGDLSIQGNSNIITATKNLPALLVTQNLIIESSSSLDVNGLVVVDGGMQVSADAASVNVLGGLFIQDPLVETTADSSVKGNKGTIVGATRIPVAAGYALDFDGVDDYVKIAADPSLDNLGAITMAAWIYPRVDAYWHVLDKGEGDKRIFAEGMNPKLYGLIRYTSMHAMSRSESDTIVLNSWQHVAMTWNQATNTTRLFRSGIEVQYDFQNIGSGSMLDDSTYPFLIGARGNLAGETFFNGLIDDVHIYDRALDVNEVNIVKAGGTVSNLVGRWKLDEAGSTIIVTAAPSKTAIIVWSGDGNAEKWGQAAGAFFRSIERR